MAACSGTLAGIAAGRVLPGDLEEPWMPRGPRTILMVASEAVPFAKTGGLADVAGALPVALARLGHRVTLVLPRYGEREEAPDGDRIGLALGGRSVAVGFVEHALAEGATAVLVDCPELFGREGLYGVGSRDFADNPRRFAVLARAALEYSSQGGVRPDVVHAHDWQAGLVPVYLKTHYGQNAVLGHAASVFTIHNLAYQGLFPPEWLAELDLPREMFTIDGLEFWGKISFLKAGINFADIITTVSPTYAEEIRAPEFGFGFEGILERRRHDLVGILNGIDVERWDPARDPHVPVPFDRNALDGKAAAKLRLLETMNLVSDTEAMSRPLVGMISRLVDQKGFDLIAEVAEELVALDAAFVLLGSGEARYEEQWRNLAARHPDRVGVRIGFDDPLAHLIEAGADMFLMPSRFEPCGLNQMYSQRYGTVPIVRGTGGLDDTVRRWNAHTGSGSGFKFFEATGAALLRTVKRALGVYRDRDAWRTLQISGMAQNFSWEASAKHYLRVYGRASRARGGGETTDGPAESLEG